MNEVREVRPPVSNDDPFQHGLVQIIRRTEALAKPIEVYDTFCRPGIIWEELGINTKVISIVRPKCHALRGVKAFQRFAKPRLPVLSRPHCLKCFFVAKCARYDRRSGNIIEFTTDE